MQEMQQRQGQEATDAEQMRMCDCEEGGQTVTPGELPVRAALRRTAIQSSCQAFLAVPCHDYVLVLTERDDDQDTLEQLRTARPECVRLCNDHAEHYRTYNSWAS